MKNKNNLDEMQEQKLLKIEHNGLWFVFWALAAAVIIEPMILGEYALKEIVGEGIILLCLSIYLLVACVRNGIWDRKLKANTKTNVVVSLIASTIIGVINFISSYIKYGKLYGSIATGVIMFISMFVMCIFLLSVVMVVYKNELKSLKMNRTNYRAFDNLIIIGCFFYSRLFQYFFWNLNIYTFLTVTLNV